MEEFRNQMKVVVRALNTGMPHVSAEVWEHGIDINTSGDPPVQIAEREVMSEIVRPRSVAASLPKAGGFPNSLKDCAHVFSATAI